jgi:hypothetical protein
MPVNLIILILNWENDFREYSIPAKRSLIVNFFYRHTGPDQEI